METSPTHGSVASASHGGPASPVHGAGMSMEDLVRSLNLSVEAATRAANAAADSMQRSGGSQQKDLYKLLPKPSSFNPSDRDQEVLQWRDWYWTVRQYIAVIDGKFLEDLDYIEGHMDNELDFDFLSSEEQGRGRFLYGLLGSLVQGRLLGLVRNVSDSNGGEALRQLLLNCQPKARNRTMSLLQGIMSYPSFNMKTSILAQILRLEEHFLQYEKLGGKIGEEMKAAVLLRSLSGPLKTHLNLTLNEGSSYAKIRESVISFDMATTKWNEAGSLSYVAPQNDPTGVMPMEVDRVQKGKGKNSKGKGKGKDSKGKGKSSEKGKSKGKGDWRQDDKGQGGKDYGKGQKGKSKSKDKDKTSLACYTCGQVGHVARDCWRNVRQVGQETTVRAGSDASAAASDTATTITAAGPAKPAVKRIHQVSPEAPHFVESEHEVKVFDLRCLKEVEQKSVRVVQFFIGDMENEEVALDGPSTVRTTSRKSRERSTKLIVDSGADAAVFPLEWMTSGRAVCGEELPLQDAQGRRIPTQGCRDVEILLGTQSGVPVVLRERVVFSSEVSQPILCFGKLLQSGWSIDAEEQCLANQSVRVPLEFQNRSLVVQGTIRMVSEVPAVVRMLQVALGPQLLEFKDRTHGWHEENNEFWKGIHIGCNFQNPAYVPGLSQEHDWHRTTLVCSEGRWFLVELAESLSSMEDHQLPIPEVMENVPIMTFVTYEYFTPEEMGFQILEENPFATVEHAKSVEERAEVIPEAPVAMEEGGESGEELERKEELERREDESDSLRQEVEVEVGPLLPKTILVNGIELSEEESSLKALRAACTFYGISTNGSKNKCYQRLVNHQKKVELQAVTEAVSQARGALERFPREQAVATLPSKEEQKRHMLTHTPYANWCTACIKHRARPDRHERSGEARDTGCPIISFDFSYTKASGVAGSEEDVGDGKEPKAALWLVMACSHTGYLNAVPQTSKAQINLITNEILAFSQALGHPEVGYFGDNEPTVRQILRMLLNARHALGLKTQIFTTKIRDPAGNGLAENAIGRIRSLAATLMEDVNEEIGIRLNTEHPLWGWAARNAAWMISRFQPYKGQTSFEVVHGHAYRGTLARFGEPVFGYTKVGNSKGDPKWRLGVYLGKTEAQDAYIIGEGGRVLLTKSIRRVDRSWKHYLALYTGFQAHSWEFQTNFGGRIVPTKREALPVGARGRATREQMEFLQGMMDPEAAAVEAYALSLQGRLEDRAEREEARREVELVRGSESSVPTALEAEVLGGVPSAETTSMAVSPEEVIAPSSAFLRPASPRSQPPKQPSPESDALQAEPVTKRSRVETSETGEVAHIVAHIRMVERSLQTTGFGNESYNHLDENVSFEEFHACLESEEVFHEETKGESSEIPEELWSDEPLTRVPPDPDPLVDRIADSLEEKRLKSMGVLENLKEDEWDLEILTTRFVFDWRIKEKKMPKGNKMRKWRRRARLVAREYANSKRDDVHSPASGCHSHRLLLVLYLAEKAREFGNREVVLGSLDVKDAFLQVPQEKPVQIVTELGRFKVVRNLPGQRIGARAWFDYFVSFLEQRGFSFCPENPCLGKMEDKVQLFIHVDDVMFIGEIGYVQEVFLPELKKAFEISETILKSPGDEMSFLKRTYRLEPDGLSILPGRYGEDMIEAFEKRYSAVKLQNVPAGAEIQEPDGSPLLGYEEASLYRSLVGSGIYLGQERWDVCFAVKELASYMTNPTVGAMDRMRKLLGYLKKTRGYYTHLGFPRDGQGLQVQSQSKWILESYTDADWSGHRGHRRSTSCGVHLLNGIPLFASARGQKVVSLSSAESELHALVSGASDGIFLKRCLEFLLEEEIRHTCLIDNSATKQIANKRGNGRLRHVSGKLLWVQDKVIAKELEVSQVSSQSNISDIGTKPLSRQRMSFLLFWIGYRDAEGNAVGEEEAAQVRDTKISKAKIMELAKFIQKVTALSGLELVAGQSCDVGTQRNFESLMWQWLIVIAVLMMCVFLGFLWLCFKNHRMRRQLEDLHRLHGARTMADDQFRTEMERTWSMQLDYCQRLERGIIHRGGFVDMEEVTHEDRERLNFLAKINRNRKKRFLEQAATDYNVRYIDRMGEMLRDDTGRIRSRSNSRSRTATVRTATILTDSGEVIEVNVEDLEVEGSPEPDPETPDETMGVEEQQETESNTTPEREFEVEPIDFDFTTLEGLTRFEARMEFEMLGKLHREAFEEQRFATAQNYGREMAECSQFMD